MTAKEILNKQEVTRSPINGLEIYLESNAIKAMIEFAKYHVQEALRAAAEDAKVGKDNFNMRSENVDADSILNSYPLNNIK